MYMGDNMIYKIGVCDDEIFYIEKIEYLINEHFKKSKKEYTITIFQSGKDLSNSINELDILFLDIEMGDICGIDIKNQLSMVPNTCKIIFVSNHVQRMQEAFGKNVIAFINKAELETIDATLSKIEKEEEEHHIIEISDYRVDIFDIMYAKANGSYTEVYTTMKEKTCCIYLKSLLQRLNGYNFIQVHRSYIVNMKYIKNLTKDLVILTNDCEVPISRKYRTEVSLKYYEYVRENKV